MTTLLNNSLAPLTLQIGFWEAPLMKVSEEYLRWVRPHYRAVDTENLEADLRSALLHLPPLSTPGRRFLLLSTDSQWTAYFDNGRNGPDARSPIAYLTEKLGCRGVIATCIPHTLATESGTGKGTYGAVIFELFGPTQTEFLNYERSISVAYDGGKWRFDVQGKVQPFEEIGRYSARKIAERFTPEMLQRYCNALGIRVFDQDFYGGRGLLVVVRDPLPSGSKEVSLDEARKQLAFA
jgi:hypothetical protein